ncbi:MAG: transcription termination/antitermination protein NusA [Bryobacterales bacterium]|nr:transcription termination/antitermination protein NusA [Bryobacterales bacterium]
MPGIYSQIEELSQLKNIDPAIVMDAVKDAILVAARKYYKSNEELIAELNPETGNVEVFALMTVTDLVANPAREVSINQARKKQPGVQVGDQIRVAKPTEGLGRISAQMAKQVIFQKIREAERDTICAEFQDRLGNLETCTIKRSEGPDMIVDLGRTEARLPRREQSRLESFSPGDRVRVIVKTIEKAGRGPAVIVSRASEELVKRLFEQEVPEIYDGTVKIRACAREAGERTKIAVQSNDRDVDPVGACVGMKGMRVQSIIRELRGEKIDIIEYADDAVELAGRALSPARISRVTVIDPMTRHLEVVVDETQLSLAIGKKGQNVRLAAKLLGWRIDIKSEEEKRQEVEAAMAAMSGAGTPVSILIDFGLPEDLADKLIEAGSATVEALADMTPEQLGQIEGMDEGMLERIQLAVNGYYGQFEQPLAQTQPLDPSQPMTEEAAGDAPKPVKAGPMVLPGLPMEGSEDEEEDDEEIPLDDFDTMNMRTSYTNADSAPIEKDLDDDGEEDATEDERES